MSHPAVKSQLLKFSVTSKKVLTPDELQLYELSQLAGLTFDPSVFKILLDLLKMNVSPTAVLQMLKSMSGQRRKKGETRKPVAAAAPLPQTSRAKQNYGHRSDFYPHK
ncbi:hypothetical protein ScPMuIL_005739 [Solemya velum]